MTLLDHSLMIYLSDIYTCTCMYKMDGEEYNEIVNTLMRERRGGSSGGGTPAPGARPPPLKLEKI
jgi:hypothetical protein